MISAPTMDYEQPYKLPFAAPVRNKKPSFRFGNRAGWNDGLLFTFLPQE